MKTLLEAIYQTPWWVYALFIYLVIIGVKSFKPSVVSLKRLFVIPALFFIWLLYSLISKDQINDFNTALLFAISLVIGTGIGWLTVLNKKVKADKEKKLAWIEGGPTLLIFVLTIFVVKYYFGFTYATEPNLRHNATYLFWDIGLSGVFTGIFLGRTLNLIFKYNKAGHTPLEKSS